MTGPPYNRKASVSAGKLENRGLSRFVQPRVKPLANVFVKSTLCKAASNPFFPVSEAIAEERVYRFRGNAPSEPLSLIVSLSFLPLENGKIWSEKGMGLLVSKRNAPGGRNGAIREAIAGKTLGDYAGKGCPALEKASESNLNGPGPTVRSGRGADRP